MVLRVMKARQRAVHPGGDVDVRIIIELARARKRNGPPEPWEAPMDRGEPLHLTRRWRSTPPSTSDFQPGAGGVPGPPGCRPGRRGPGPGPSGVGRGLGRGRGARGVGGRGLGCGRRGGGRRGNRRALCGCERHRLAGAHRLPEPIDWPEPYGAVGLARAIGARVHGRVAAVDGGGIDRRPTSQQTSTCCRFLWPNRPPNSPCRWCLPP